MKLSILTLLGGVVTLSFAHPAPPTHVVHEKRETQLDKWAKRDTKLNRDTMIPLSIGLTQRNLGKLTHYCNFVPLFGDKPKLLSSLRRIGKVRRT